MDMPRPEHPRPQAFRPSWINLNGTWEYEIDHGRSGRARNLVSTPFTGAIRVPFCPESKLSGVEYTDFMAAVWYRRTFELPADWHGKRVLLHFGAVDYDAEVWVNGRSIGTHRGGYSSFSFEITDALTSGENTIAVCAEDDTRSPLQPSGKQSYLFNSHGCHYTRTTGIWQTVWLEAVPQTYLGRPHITPDLENGCAFVEVPVIGDTAGTTLHAEAELNGKVVGLASAQPSGHCCRVMLPIDDVRPWAPGSPTLYDLKLSLNAGENKVDSLQSYFGLRSITLAPPAILLNGRPVFQRLILDQGFYPDGIYTAPSDDALRADIELSMAMGFNGARLHEKVFEERFLYWADRLGYIVWGEMANWGLDLTQPLALEHFVTEWREIIERDYSHPSIVGWCPFNETQHNQNPGVLRQVYRLTKSLDSTRPVIDTSGWTHVETDVYDVHDYEQDPEKLKQNYAGFAQGEEPRRCNPEKDAPYAGQPYFVSEFGGTWWNPAVAEEQSWGYGERPKTEQEFIERYRGLLDALLDHPKMCGFCYTQLTDVEQEQNGLYTYDRKPKFDANVMRQITARKAAIEE